MLTENIRQSFEKLLKPNQWTTNPVELITYEVDGGLNRGAPDGVAFPQSAEEVVRLAHWAAEHRVPLVARSAGTGLSGGAVPSFGGIVLSFARMNQVLEIDETDRVAIVQPGLINLTLDTLVKRQGYYYPPDPASQRAATIGGNIAENAGGPHCFKYGVTTNYVMGLTVVLADGQLVHTGGRAFDYPEYDFTGLLTGSEGMLGIVTQATLRLIRNPTGFKTMIATFDSVEEAGQAVSAIIARGLVPAALEMMDRNIAGIIEDYAHAGLPTEAAALLLVEADGYPDSLDAQIAEVVEVLKQQNARQMRICQTPAERDQIWLARKSAFGAMARLSPAYFQVDGTVPRSKLAETLAGINQLCARLGLRVGYVFHAGDGNLHPLIPFDPSDPDMDRRVHEAGDGIMALAASKDGAISGEHGVGVEKRKYMRLMYSEDELAAMREVKQVFDPQNILNPGKVFPDDGHTAPTRDVPPAITAPLPPVFAPKTEEEAAQGLRVANATGQRVLIRSTGNHKSDVTILSTEALNGVVTFAPDDLYVTVKAGTRQMDAQAALAAHRLWIPLASPWAESTVGGIVSAGFNSPYRLRYGAVRDQVLGLRVVMPDGRRMRFGRPVVKNVAGYDMPKLFVGAYGTLGLITEVTLRVTAQPRARRTLLVPIDDLATGLKLGQSLQRLSVIASAVLLCKGCVAPGGSSPYLLAFTSEGYPQDVEAELRAARGVVSGTETEEVSGFDLWAGLLRRASSHLRVGVSPKNMSDLIQSNLSALGDAFVADITTGSVYVAPAPVAHVTALREAAHKSGGYAVVIGAPNPGLDPWGYVPETLPLMHRLKAHWDPKGYLNPGAFLV
jgi:D-lactate dehydrogenase (cytochrome)